jgi:hypothetical protein
MLSARAAPSLQFARNSSLASQRRAAVPLLRSAAHPAMAGPSRGKRAIAQVRTCHEAEIGSGRAAQDCSGGKQKSRCAHCSCLPALQALSTPARWLQSHCRACWLHCSDLRAAFLGLAGWQRAGPPCCAARFLHGNTLRRHRCRRRPRVAAVRRGRARLAGGWRGRSRARGRGAEPPRVAQRRCGRTVYGRVCRWAAQRAGAGPPSRLRALAQQLAAVRPCFSCPPLPLQAALGCPARSSPHPPLPRPRPPQSHPAGSLTPCGAALRRAPRPCPAGSCWR